MTQLNFGVALNTMSRTELFGSLPHTQLVTQVLRGIPVIGGNGSYFIAQTEVNRWRDQECLRKLRHPPLRGADHVVRSGH